jgi:hypothetical protein
MSVLVNGSVVVYGDLTNSMESNDFLYELVEILSCTQDTVVSLDVNGKSYRAKPEDCVAELANAQQAGDKTDDWSISLKEGRQRSSALCVPSPGVLVRNRPGVGEAWRLLHATNTESDSEMLSRRLRRASSNM